MAMLPNSFTNQEEQVIESPNSQSSRPTSPQYEPTDTESDEDNGNDLTPLQNSSFIQAPRRGSMMNLHKAIHEMMQIMPEEDALKAAEPEDQDYYGIGSRSARFTINMGLGIVYGTLCPPMNLLCWLNFFFCRLFYGYLIPFAETKKPDLGGPFWVEQLKHLFVGNIPYCIVMCGVLYRSSQPYLCSVVVQPLRKSIFLGIASNPSTCGSGPEAVRESVAYVGRYM